MIKALPMLLSYLIIYVILPILEKKFSIIEKLDSKIKFKIKNNYKESFYAISPVILNFILGVVGIYFVDLQWALVLHLVFLQNNMNNLIINK